MSKPLVATGVPGCRDETPASDRLRMGELGRRKIEQEYCETRVIDKYLEALDSR